MAGVVVDERFEIREPLGRSEGGESYLAHDLEEDQPVYMKLLRPSSADSNEALQRRMQEYELLRKLDHPNAVRAVKAGLTQDNAFYMAFEYVEGVRLSQIIDDVGAVAAEILVNYLDQIAEVLDLAHEYGIVHRDVRPRNIMIQADAQGRETCRLLGFGSAKVLTDKENVTQAGVTVGTVSYMSPEQAMGRSVNKLSDVYSLGVTLYSALTGRLPFEGNTAVKVMIGHVKTPVPSFAEKNPNVDVPETVEAVVLQAMSKEAAYRPKSATELANMFREAVENPEEIPKDLAELQSSSARLAVAVAEESAAQRETAKDSGAPMLLILAFVVVGVVAGLLLMNGMSLFNGQ